MQNSDSFQNADSTRITLNLHDSITREVIMIDEKSLNLLIRDYTAGKETLKDAVGYLMTVAAITLTFATADFHDFFLDASVWKAVFLIGDVILFYKACTSFVNYWRTKIKTPEDLVEKLKSESTSHLKTTVTLTPFV